MSRFDKLLKQKTKALSIFEKTKTSLSQFIDSMVHEQSKCQATIKDLEVVIEQEHSNILLIQKEVADATKTIENINKILGVEKS